MLEDFIDIYQEVDNEEAAEYFTQNEKIQIALGILQLETNNRKLDEIIGGLDEIDKSIHAL